jgi:hypothetical protein
MLTTLFKWHMLNKFADTLLCTAFDSATKCIKKINLSRNITSHLKIIILHKFARIKMKKK